MQKSLLHLLVGAALVSGIISSHAAPTRTRPRTPRTPPHVDAFNAGTERLLDMELSAAEQLLRRAVRMRDNFAEAHNNLAFVLRKQGEDRFEEALNHYNRATELDPTLAEAFMYRGVLYVHMGEMELAQSDFETLQSLDADLAEELQWVIDHGHEKEPEHFFGVVREVE